MRKFMFMSLMLLSILVGHQAQGTRLIKGSLSTAKYKVHEDKSDMSRSNLGFGEVNHPSMESHGSVSGSNRKLMTKSFSTSTTKTLENDKNGHDQGNNKADQTPTGQSNSDRLGGSKEENFSVNSSPETASDHYPDIIDIAGMDYSPAKRKPPIHN